MNKRELVEAVCAQLETTKTAAEETVNVVLKAVQEGVRLMAKFRLPVSAPGTCGSGLPAPAATLKPVSPWKLAQALVLASSPPKLGKIP